MIKKVTIFLFAFVVFGFVTAGNASAHDVYAESGAALRHAYKPTTVSETGWMKARVDNFAPMPVSTLVCVTAYNQANGNGTHLGCLKVNLDSHNGNNWAVEFNAPTYQLAPGTYTVAYTYQDGAGNWQRIKSLSLQIQDGVYRAW